MPAYPWLLENAVDAATLANHMSALRTIGVPYTDDDIAGIADAVRGKSEMDAMIAYLQGLGRYAPKRGLPVPAATAATADTGADRAGDPGAAP
jgi:cytochrome c oxidase cbb3-type subunit 2